MNAPSQKHDGMGSLYYSGDDTARFRVWAPFAPGVDVVLDPPCRQHHLRARQRSRHVQLVGRRYTRAAKHALPVPHHHRTGQDNDTSQPHIRTDARALQVEGSDAACRAISSTPSL